MRPARLRQHLSYANVMATVAVFIALGGSSYAVTKIPGSSIKARSIDGSKLKPNTLTSRHIDSGAIGMSELNNGVESLLGKANQVAVSPPGPKGDPGAAGPAGAAGAKGDPGPASCSGPLLCPDAEVPDQGAMVVQMEGIGSVRFDRYRTTCTTSNGCTILLSEPGPVPPVMQSWYDVAIANPEIAERDVTLLFVDRFGVPLRSYVAVNAAPTTLIDEGGRYQVTLSADAISTTQ